MSNYEVQIQTRFGQLTISFDSPEEFRQRLQELDIEAMTAAVDKHLRDVIIAQPREIKPALQEVCRFTGRGHLEFLKPPRDKVDAIGVVLYAFDPDPVELRAIKGFTGVQDPGSYLANKAYRQYFEAISRGVYRLTHEGKLWVTDEVMPSLVGQFDTTEQ